MIERENDRVIRSSLILEEFKRYRDNIHNKDEHNQLEDYFMSVAITTIKNYLNNPRIDAVYIEANFEDAILEMMNHAVKVRDTEHIKNVIQGKRSITYDNKSSFEITKEVARLLPTPFVRMF